MPRFPTATNPAPSLGLLLVKRSKAQRLCQNNQGEGARPAGRTPRLEAKETMTLLHDSELNIQPDGSLDWDGELLSGFDMLIASVPGSECSRTELTDRRYVLTGGPSCGWASDSAIWLDLASRRSVRGLGSAEERSVAMFCSSRSPRDCSSRSARGATRAFGPGRMRS